MAESLLKLKWNSHLSSLKKVFESLRTKSRYTDVTLACEGRLFTVHRLVLASCSQFFDHIFEQTPAENTVIVLNEARAQDIESLLDYMYCGEVDVLQNNLSSFLKTAECLQIKGLAVPDDSFEIGNLQNEIIESPRKRKKCNSRPSSAGPSCPIPDKVNHSRDGLSSKAPSPTLSNIIPSRWIFQRSDLPNTTWSSQGHSDSVIVENETHSESDRHQKDDVNRTWTSDSSDTKQSHSKISNLVNESMYHYESQRCTPEGHCQSEALPLKVSRSSHIESSSKALEIKIEPKEEKPFVIDESENSNIEFHYPQELDLNKFHRERGEGAHTPNSINDYRQSATIKSYSTPDDHTTKLISITTPSEKQSASQKTSTSSNIHLLENITSSSVENALSPNQQATLSPKLMPFAKCSNCFTNNTKLWRRSLNGEIVCNACGLYFKLHGVNRPSHLFRNAPMTRRRNPKKKRKDEMADTREHYNSSEEMQDSYYNEASCDADTQEGLAVLNAALTLNSLFAKAKAQEAAAKNSNAYQNSAPASTSNKVNSSANENLSTSSSHSQYGCENTSTPSATESRPGPPPLLKLPLRASPPNSRPVTYFQQQQASPTVNESGWNSSKSSDDDPAAKIAPNHKNANNPVSGNDLSVVTWQDDAKDARLNSKNEFSKYHKSLTVSSDIKEARVTFVRETE